MSIYVRTMSVKKTVRRQLQNKVDGAAAGPASSLQIPTGGWIATVRNALGMSGAQLGRRLGLSRGRISQMEKAEADGGVTLRSIKEAADAMGCRFVYAMIPEGGRIEVVITRQAQKKAQALVAHASTHMALEMQSLPDEKQEEEVQRLMRELADRQPPDFWENG